MPHQTTAARLLALVEANWYKRGVHRKHNDKTRHNHNYTLRRYVLWHLGAIECDYAKRGLPLPNEADVYAQCLL